jgi:hypothetical protein
MTSSGLLTGAVGVDFYSALAAENAVNFSIDTLPPGLSLDPATGEITGTPTVGGRYTVKATTTNTGGANTCDLIFDIAATPGVPAFSSDLAARGYVGTSFYYFASASNQPTRYEADGLPPGLAINPATPRSRSARSMPAASPPQNSPSTSPCRTCP